MTRNILKEEIIGKHFWLWPLFCLQAGLINSGGFLACHRFVSHVTGFGTRVGVEFIQGKFLLGIEMLLIPLCFIAGCMMAGYFTEIRPIKGKKMSATVPLTIMSLLLTIVTIFGQLNFFGTFGEPLELQRDFALLGILCFVCGLQNATIASITGGNVRTTHLTGMSTDLGLNATRLIFNNTPVDRRWFRLRILKLTFFSLGAAVGTMLFFKLHYRGFIVPAGMNLILWLWMRAQLREQE